jgi:uncharacterized protein YcgI (DUF1989 family)
MNSIEIPARRGVAVPLKKDQKIKIINTYGGQVVDMWCFLPDGSQHLSMPHSVVTLGRIKPLPGDKLYSQLRKPLLEIEEDHSPGTHCMLFAACDIERYKLLGCTEYHDNCADNLREATNSLGIAPPYIPTPLNLFMNTKFHQHQAMVIEAPEAKAGDFIIFRALQDCVMAFSACPQDLVPVNAHGCTPQAVEYQIID